MMRLSKPWLLAGLLALLAGTWAAAGYYSQQSRLYAQLAQLNQVLQTENEAVDKQADGAIYGMQAAVAKNHNQPADVAALRQAETVRNCVRRLLGALRAYGDSLRRATGNAAPAGQLPQPTATEQLPAPRQQALRQQLAACADTLRQFGPASLAALPAPALASTTPVVETLADFSELESTLLAQQARTLQHLAKSVGAKTIVANRLLAVASAEASVVAPGDTYRAELFLIAHFGPDVRMQMACNGHPVPVDASGVGLVRFRAPQKPGPASWTGTIRFNENGRDTTYQVRVPYRVARR